MWLLYLVEAGGRSILGEFYHPLQRLGEDDGVLRIGRVVAGDGDAPQHRHLRFAHIQGASFDGVRFRDLAEAGISEVSPERLLGELSLFPEQVDAVLELVDLVKNPPAGVFQAVGTPVKGDSHRLAPDP